MFSKVSAMPCKGKDKASSLDIAPLTILDSFTTSEVAADWHWL